MRLGFLIPLGLALLAGRAAAAVTVLGGGQAQACYKAAFAGQSNDSAIGLCDSALENEVLQPHDRGGTFINRGVMKLRRRDYAGATVDFNSGLALDPNIGEGYANRGAAYVGEHRYREGVADIDRALQLSIREPEKAYFNRALADEGLGDEKAAYLDFKQAQSLKPAWDAPKIELLRFTVSQR